MEDTSRGRITDEIRLSSETHTMRRPIEYDCSPEDCMAGLGRIGEVHARNLLRISRETGACEVVALVDANSASVRRFAQENGCSATLFTSVKELAAAGVCSATFIATPTETHREHATTLIRAGQRVLLEKPLTGTIEGDRQFAAELDREY